MTQQLPKSDSIEELARFWDTHDLTDFEAELEEAQEAVFVRQRETVSVPLESAELAQVKEIAASRGVDESALIHEWVRERLGQR